MLNLRCESPTAWVEAVMADFDTFLIDHAACERKASAAALSFVVRYPDRSETACRSAGRRIRELLRRHGAGTLCNEPETYLPPGLIGWVPAMGRLPAVDLDEALRYLELVQAIEVIVVADAEPERIFETVELAWSDWSPPAAPSKSTP